MKNQYILLITLFVFIFSNAQIVDIPDANFKNALVNTNCVDTDGDALPDDDADTNNDGEIQISEAEAVLTLWVNNQDIISLEGIESFINILHLLCYNNQISTLDTSHQTNLRYLNFHDNFITSIDISQNPDLSILFCGHNQLTDIDITQNIELFELNCGDNNLLNLDISQNINLEYLSCSSNQLSSLDVSQNILLKWLSCMHNQITGLDVTQNPLITVLYCYDNLFYNLNVQNSNSTILEVFFAQNNPNLTCIQVDDVIFANNQQGWQKDDWAEYSELCELGIEDNTQVSFTIYPNPVQEVLFIESQLPIETVKIYNLQGQLIKEDFSSRVDVSQLLSTGLYFVQVTMEGKSVTKKFIKE